MHMCVSVCVYEITPVNTEKHEPPVPSRRTWGKAAGPGAPGQCLHPRVPPTLALLQHPAGRTEICCVCSAGGVAPPAHMELTVHEGPGFSPD